MRGDDTSTPPSQFKHLVALSTAGGTGSSSLLLTGDMELEREQKELSRIVIRGTSELEPRTESFSIFNIKFSDVLVINGVIQTRIKIPFEEIEVEKEPFVAVDEGLGTIEINVKRLEKIRKRIPEEELEYKCCIYWLTLPYESLSEEFKKAEDMLYNIRMFKDTLIVILDETREDIVDSLRGKFKIKELPAMIVTDRMIPLQEIKGIEKIEGWKYSSQAIKSLIKRGIFMEYLNRLYHIAKDNKLREKSLLIEITKVYGKEVYDELKDWISAIF